MSDQLVGALLGAVRMGLIVAALVVALVPIGRSAITGFCPTVEPDGGGTEHDVVPGADAGPTSDAATEGQGTTDADGGADAVGAAAAGLALASTSGTAPLAQATDATTATESPGAATTPDDGATTPVGVAPSEEPGDPCGPGIDRCLPPLVSAVLVFGDGACSDDAVSLLRSRMLPAFGVASVLLGGAWVLRPRGAGATVRRR